MIVDYYIDKWHRNIPQPYKVLPEWPNLPTIPDPTPVKMPTQEEVEEFRRLLDRAREYDKRTGQEDCEMEEKKNAIKELAKDFGLDISALGWGD